MREREARGVQELPAKVGELYLADGELRGSAIERVANDGMFEGGEVHTNLMRASGAELDFEERGGAELLKNGPVRAGVAGVCGFSSGTRRHTHAALGIARNGEFDAAARGGEFSLHEREICFLNGARAKSFRKFRVGEIVFGDEDCSARIFVQAMDDAWPQGVAALRERLATTEKCVDERAKRVSCSCVDGHAGGLVDDDEVVVFVKNVEGNGFGFCSERCARLRLNGDAFAAFELLAGLGGLAVDEHECGVNEFLNAGAGEVGAVYGDEAIEACAGVGGRG